MACFQSCSYLFPLWREMLLTILIFTHSFDSSTTLFGSSSLFQAPFLGLGFEGTFSLLPDLIFRRSPLKFTRQTQHSSASHYSQLVGMPNLPGIGVTGTKRFAVIETQCSLYWILLLSEHIWGDDFQLCAGDGSQMNSSSPEMWVQFLGWGI